MFYLFIKTGWTGFSMISNIKKNRLIESLRNNLGNITLSCEEVGIDRTTYYRLLEKNAEFKKEVDEIQNICLDVVENALFRNVKAGDTTAIIFYLKTKGRKRGYTEKQELDLSNTDGSLKTPVVNFIIQGVDKDGS